ncbi:tRNA (adenosine(37)-N6)-threonylcarbamoyltransferase complex dimerization subunit type 1 TsaB [uncultured Dokdonia sp.]|uniref:tRNA (adenosine(37)-N6)-threonylcarbamoyltransferase complex dimerization subunit type 1 TsaB n=1 Tax=uncultured Dokdonia sp. TaxID=575653 RepID=UPI002631EBCB|nr:tRNA (adenosine(37)-N6)-threonylcarbamoyltransferase complex dimerization subunit type 1 TsaB [uncultured Dokdonia sp.]
MSNILCIETATTNCSVALSIYGEQVVLKEDNDVKYSHAERLHLYIENVLDEAKIDKKELTAIAVSKGPGSYTGLRIGVSAAKGLCYALGIPLISVPTLSALSHKVNCEEGSYIVPMLDARRMEVYSAIFDANHHQVRATEAQILEEDSFSAYLEKGNVYFVGNGVSKFEDICKHPNAIFIKDTLPSAAEMCALASAKNEIDAYEDIAYFEPYYLKDFIAGIPKKK